MNKYLHIDSRQRETSSGSSHDFTIDLNKIYPDIKERWMIMSVTMPYTRYTVDDTNNKFYWSENGVSYISTLTNGYYTATTLGAEIETQMEALAGTNTYTITYSSVNHKYTIARSTGVNTFNVEFSNTLNSVGKMIGFTNEDTADDASNIVSVNVVSLDLPRLCVINIEGAENEMSVSGQVGTCTIPVNVVWGEVIHYEFPVNDNPIISFDRLPQVIKISLKDWAGNVFNLQGSEWSMSIKRV